MILLHGTTKQRAESIIKSGPLARYRESETECPESGFYMCTEAGPFILGTPREYAFLKARLFPAEGGAAILKVDVPSEIIELALDNIFPLEQGVIYFEPGHGLEELIAIWPRLTCELELTQ